MIVESLCLQVVILIWDQAWRWHRFRQGERPELFHVYGEELVPNTAKLKNEHVSLLQFCQKSATLL